MQCSCARDISLMVVLTVGVLLSVSLVNVDASWNRTEHRKHNSTVSYKHNGHNHDVINTTLQQPHINNVDRYKKQIYIHNVDGKQKYRKSSELHVSDQKQISKSIVSRHKREFNQLPNINQRQIIPINNNTMKRQFNITDRNVSLGIYDNREKRKADSQFPFLHHEGVNERLAQLLRLRSNHPELAQRRGFANNNIPPADILRRRAFLQRFDAAGVPEHNALRQRLLDALARRVQERNLIARNPALFDNPIFQRHDSIEDQHIDSMENQHGPMDNLTPRLFVEQNNPIFQRHDVDESDHLRSFPVPNQMHDERFSVPMSDLARNEMTQRLMREKEFNAQQHQPLLEQNMYPEQPDTPPYSPPPIPEEASKITSDDAPMSPRLFSNVGSLGDETMPFGSLGESKPQEIPDASKPEYIPVAPYGNVPTPDDPDTSLFTQPSQVCPIFLHIRCYYSLDYCFYGRM